MAFGLVDPTACLGVGRQRFGVDPLGRQDGNAGGVGAEVGAVLADVGIGTRSLGRCTQAVATGEPGLDEPVRLRQSPLPVDRDASRPLEQRSELRTLARSRARS